MTSRSGWTRWIRWWPRRATARPEPDFADLGTAFGLDMSLENAGQPSNGLHSTRTGVLASYAPSASRAGKGH